MVQPDFDLSEYQRSDYPSYLCHWDDCTGLSPSFFENSVSYSAEEKKLFITVSPVYEFETMLDLYEKLEHPFPEVYQKEASEDEVLVWREALQENREKFGQSHSTLLIQQSGASTHSAARKSSCRWVRVS